MTRILIVDDAPTIRLYLRDLLATPTREIHEAVNGLEALEKALVTPFDLFIVDINMPVLDGYGFLRELRRQDGPQAPAIMLSTESGADDREQAWTAGANAYLTKPVHPARLQPTVRLLLGEVAA